MKKITAMKIISVVLLSALSSLLAGCSEEIKEEKQILRPVRYHVVKYAGVEQDRTFTGIASAGTQTNLSFRVGGSINAINVKVGDKVEKGTLIATLDDKDAKLQYEDAKAAVSSARVQLETAKSNLNRIRELYEDNNVSLSDYESAKNSYSTSKSALESNLKRLDLQKRSLSYGDLYAPAGGIVARVPVEKNENVQAGTIIVELSSENDIEVTVGMPEAFISGIKTGSTVKVRFPSIQKESFDGAVTKVSYVASSASTYPVTVNLLNPERMIRPGMSAEVSFSFAREGKKERLIIPVSALGNDKSGNFVFIVKKGSEKGVATVHKVNVDPGKLTKSGFEILSGLSEGELVVMSGITKITDGMRVRFINQN